MASECMEYVDDVPQISYSTSEWPELCSRPAVDHINLHSRTGYIWYGDSSLFDEEVFPSISHEFKRLAEKWKEDTWHLSSIKKRIAHPAYLQIVGMGAGALPYIFEDLRKEPAHWFWALEAITRLDIAPDAASMDALRDAWLGWADQHGY